MKVLVTRPRAQAGAFARLLAEAGLEPVYFPVIEIQPLEDASLLDAALQRLESYHWVVFTSQNGVEAVFARLAQLHLPFPAAVNTAAIGPQTAAALARRGVRVDFVPGEYVAEAILPGLGELNGRRVLLLRADIARQALPEAIRAAGGSAEEVAAYCTVPAAADPSGLAALRAGVQAIAFTSPSTVHSFVALARRADLDPLNLPGTPKIACIGPITAQAARQAGFAVDVVAAQYTAEGLAGVLARFAGGNLHPKRLFKKSEHGSDGEGQDGS
jgi:uroporphyrinogen-III synthase